MKVLILVQFVLIVVTVSADDGVTMDDSEGEGAVLETPPTCEAADKACAKHADCCDHKCQAGVCVACKVTGAKCHQDGECCNHKCSMSKCQCLEVGAHCTLQGDCCSNECREGKCSKRPEVVVVGPPTDATDTVVQAVGGGTGTSEGTPVNPTPEHGGKSSGTICTFNPLLSLLSIVYFLTSVDSM